MIKNLKKIFRSYQGRHFLSRWARKFFERKYTRQTLGLGLVLAAFSFTIVTPQALALVETNQISQISPVEAPIETTTEVTFQYPLEDYAVSQDFSWHHWGVDLTASEGTAIHPIANGKVIEVATALFGYGNYVLIDHQNSQKSLYAHLSKQNVKTNEQVTKETEIGLIGHTGWATGDHLHLEIYQNGLPINPFEILSEK
ncbi:MAG: M23 family metallopeptidase [Candidatus Gottesmanbacteria bacterium]